MRANAVNAAGGAAKAKARPGFDVALFAPSVLDDATVERHWATLKRAIDQIHAQTNTQDLSFQTLYDCSYQLVLNRQGPLLYSRVQEALRNHLTTVGSKVAAATDDYILTAIVESWSMNLTTIAMLRDILMYMDRNYSAPYKKPGVYDMFLTHFREEVARRPDIRVRLQESLLDRIRRARLGELIVDFDAVRQAVHMLVEVGVRSKLVYEEDFERPLLKQTSEFFSNAAMQRIAHSTTPQYLEWAETQYAEEGERCKRYLDLGAEAKITLILDEHLVVQHCMTLLGMPNSDLKTLLHDETKLSDLRRMYNIFSRSQQCLDHLTTCFGTCVIDIGNAIVSRHVSQDVVVTAVQLCEELFRAKDLYENVVKSCFKSDKNLQRCLKKSLESFININSTCASALAMYTDEKLKTMVAMRDDTQLDSLLDNVIGLFRLLSDKDVFESFYKNHLAKRLLSGKSVSDDAERAMLSKLKTECGSQFTSKLEAMFNDMKLSAETMDSYRATVVGSGGAAGGDASVDCSVTILTSGCWPSMALGQQDVPIPAPLMAWKTNFEAFYLGQHTGRRLTWALSMGSCEVKGSGFKNEMVHDFTVTLFQACAMLLLSDGASKTLQEIALHLNIPTDECKRQLISLAVGKFNVLLKSGSIKELKSDDVYQANPGFVSKLRKVRIPLVSASSKGLGSSGNLGPTAMGGLLAADLPPEVREDRAHLIDAAIVRIMKSRKKLEHVNLVAEVTRQMSTRFNPTPQDIKKRIENLIEREYMERDSADGRIYVYLA